MHSRILGNDGSHYREATEDENEKKEANHDDTDDDVDDVRAAGEEADDERDGDEDKNDENKRNNNGHGNNGNSYDKDQDNKKDYHGDDNEDKEINDKKEDNGKEQDEEPDNVVRKEDDDQQRNNEHSDNNSTEEKAEKRGQNVEVSHEKGNHFKDKNDNLESEAKEINQKENVLEKENVLIITNGVKEVSQQDPNESFGTIHTKEQLEDRKIREADADTREVVASVLAKTGHSLSSKVQKPLHKSRIPALKEWKQRFGEDRYLDLEDALSHVLNQLDLLREETFQT